LVFGEFPMKILHVVQAYHPAVGGSEWLTRNLSEHLVSRYGDEVTVFTTNAYKPEAFWRTKGPFMSPGIESINGVTVRRFKVFNGLQLVRRLLAQGSHRLNLPYNDWLRTIQTGPLILDMTRAIANSGADVVFATAFPFLHMYYALAGARRAGTPVVFLGAIHVADRWSYDRKMVYQAIGQADAYVAHTTFERDYLIQRGIRPNHIAVIGAGVDANDFGNADGTEVRQRYGWGSGAVVGVLARQSELKRLDILLQAMLQVWAVRPNVHLLMAGARTSYSPQIDRMINGLPSEQQAQVTVINDFSEEEKPRLLAACDLLAHPSGNESFGIAFIEAWACGKPVVGARVGAVPSVIDEDQDGLLFRYLDPDGMAQAILALLADPSRRIRMGKAGRRKVLANYTWDIVTDRLRAVYTEVVSRYESFPQAP
jgi:glycosyltransferase involved in cell wall biosynthesis